MTPTTPDPRREHVGRDVRTEPTSAEPTRAEPTRAEAAHAEAARGGAVRTDPVRTERVYDEAAARERFGGTNVGAAFFGWLVAVGMTALLTGLLAVLATAIGYSNQITQTEAERAAGTVTLVTAIVLLAVLLVAYYSGGYVAGRMSRFDGGRQGVMVWVIGLVVTIVAAVLGWIAGDQYNLLDRVNVPRIPIPTDQVTVAGLITVLVVLVGTLLAAMLGGKVGRRYHVRVERAVL